MCGNKLPGANSWLCLKTGWGQIQVEDKCLPISSSLIGGSPSRPACREPQGQRPIAATWEGGCGGKGDGILSPPKWGEAGVGRILSTAPQGKGLALLGMSPEACVDPLLPWLSGKVELALTQRSQGRRGLNPHEASPFQCYHPRPPASPEPGRIG